MDRTERFYKIELLLRGRGSVSFEVLQQELDVSAATLKRDLQYLRDRLSAPIVYDRFDNGYRFDAEAAGMKGARQELPGMWFSEKEIHALLTMHQLMAGLDDDGVLSRHLAPMMDKLQGMACHRALRLMADLLTPIEAAIVLLREVFDIDHLSLAERAGKSEATWSRSSCPSSCASR